MTLRPVQPDATATRRALPPELLYHIIEGVLPSDPEILLPSSHASTKTLLALTRVSRDTYRLATKLLRQRCIFIDSEQRLANILLCIPRFVPNLPTTFSLRNITSLYLEPFRETLDDKLTASWVRDLFFEVSESLRKLVVLMPFNSLDIFNDRHGIRKMLRDGFESLHRLEEFVSIGDYPTLSLPDGPTDIWRLFHDLKRLTLFGVPLSNHWLWWNIATLPKLEHVILARSQRSLGINIKDEYFHKLPQGDARLDRDIKIVLMDDSGLWPNVTTTRWKEIDPNGRMTVELHGIPDVAKYGAPQLSDKLVAAYVKDRVVNGRLWDGKADVVLEEID